MLERRPGSECAKQGVEAPEEHFWDDPSGAADDLLAWLGLLAVGLGLFAAVVALWLVPMTRIPGLRRLPPASRIRAVRLGIESFEDNATPSQGGTLAALARGKMESFGAGNPHMRMVDSRAAAEETIWTKLGAINDQAKGVSAAIEAISVFYPRRRFVATGVLAADSGNGPGLSLSVRKKQSVVGATTLWAKNFGLDAAEGDAAKVERLQKLAAPAAASIVHVSLTGAGEAPGRPRTRSAGRSSRPAANGSGMATTRRRPPSTKRRLSSTRATGAPSPSSGSWNSNSRSTRRPRSCWKKPWICWRTRALG